MPTKPFCAIKNETKNKMDEFTDKLIQSKTEVFRKYLKESERKIIK